MAESSLLHDPQALTRLDSVACIFTWARSMPVPDRKRFLGALVECSDEVQQVVVTLVNRVKDSNTTPDERSRALMTIADALALNPCEKNGPSGHTLIASVPSTVTQSAAPARAVQKMETQEQTFAERLKELLAKKQISQQELATRMGCSQPAISLMLRRMCRPQKKTILKLAEALSVHPSELWPDIDVTDMLDAVASFQEDDYTMTEAEANALADTAKKNRPKIRVKSLPPRPE